MNNARHILNELRNYRKAVKESYLSEELPTNDEDFENQVPHEEDEHEMMNNDEEHSAIDMDDNEVVNNIRKLSLKGIQKYSEEVSNPLYEFYKKIWAECDKLITDAVKKQEIGGKK